MATIPTVNALGARPTPTAVGPVIREDRSAPARAMQQLGQTVTRIGEEHERRQDEAAFLDAQVQANNWEAENIHDPEKGAKAKRGKDAFHLQETLPATFDQFRDKVVSGLSNNRQRQMVGKLLDSRRGQLLQWTGDYVGREREAYEEGTFKAGLASSVGRVALDPTQVDQERRVQSVAVLNRMRRRGAGQPEIDLALAALDSDLNTAVLDNYLGNEQYAKAREHFSKVSDRLMPDARAKYKKAVDEAGVRLQSQENADGIIAKAGSRAAALALARKIEDPEVRDATEQRVSRYWSEREQGDNEREARAYSAALSLVENGEAKTRADIPVATWNDMSGEQQARVNDRLRQRATGADVVTNSNVYYELDQLAADNPQKFGDLDLVPYFPHLAPADREKLSGLQRRLKAGEVAGFQTVRDVREGLVKEVYGNTPKGEKLERANALRRRFDEAVLAEQEGGGKRVNSQRAQEIKKSLLVEVVTSPGLVWDTEKPVYEIGIEDVPAAERAEIEGALKRKGRTVTEQLIVDLYVRGKARPE